MKHFIAFIKENKSDLLQVAFVFFVLAVGLIELHKTLPFMPWHSNIFIPIFVLLYIVYFLILESVKNNRIRNAILYKISDSAVRFCHQNKRNLVSVAMVILAISGVDMINRYCHLNLPKNSINGLREKAVVLSVDNSQVMQSGPVSMGEQYCTVLIKSGKYTGQQATAINMLRAQMELDSLFQAGDLIQIAVSEIGQNPDGSPQLYVVPQAHYRIHYEVILFQIFALLLIIFGGFTGLKALLTFVFSCSVIWQLLVPLCLKGYNPIWIALIAVCFLCAVIIFAIAGFGMKGWTAFLGSFLGVLSSCAMAKLFTALLHVNGNVMSRSQALFFAGYEYLNMTDLFIGSLFLASSGAVMDLAMDVSAGMRELVYHKPGIGRRELLASGLRIGKSVVGTMSTTLLLAYAGGYLTLMMSFQAEGVMMEDILNYPYVVPEIVKTLVGSIGLVLVAPLTALVGCWLMKYAKGPVQD